MNFMVFELCNNDYGWYMRDAIEYAVGNSFFESAGEDCVWWKAFIIQYTVMSMLMRRYRTEDELANSIDYLTKYLTVYTSDKWPTYDGVQTLDHDGGSVVLDLHTGFATQI
jgi:hypothetical protein